MVVAGGAAYKVDVERKVACEVASDVKWLEYYPRKHGFVLGNGLLFECISASGTAWRTRRISWAEMRCIRLDHDKIIGEASSPMGPPDWYSFEVDLTSGQVEGGSYKDGMPLTEAIDRGLIAGRSA